MPHTRSVAVGVFVGAGSRYEADQIAGASHYLEHVLFKGTEKRPEPQLISGAIESVGGMMNASTDREATMYFCKVAATHFPLALDVLTDMARHPLFAPNEVERERGVIIEELNMTNDQPDAYADMLIDEALWPDQAMGRDIGGTKESVGAISRLALADYHSSQYVPNNVVVSVAGNIAHDEVVSRVDEILGDWPAGDPLPWEDVRPSGEGVRVRLGNRHTDQAHLCLAVEGVSAVSPDRYTVDMLNAVLGEGMTSRLFMELRERRGLAYDVHSSSMHYRDCGALVVTSGVDPSNVNEAITAVIGEFEKLGEDVPQQDLGPGRRVRCRTAGPAPGGHPRGDGLDGRTGVAARSGADSRRGCRFAAEDHHQRSPRRRPRVPSQRRLPPRSRGAVPLRGALPPTAARLSRAP